MEFLMFTIDLGVPFTEDKNAFEVSNFIETKIVQRFAVSAGSGFGYRDMQFDGYETNESARATTTKIVEYLQSIGFDKVMTNDTPMVDTLALTKDRAPYVTFYNEDENSEE